MKKTNTSQPTIGIIGLGIMGGIMAQTLIQNQYQVVGFDIDQTACKRLKKLGGKALKSVSEVV